MDPELVRMTIGCEISLNYTKYKYKYNSEYKDVILNKFLLNSYI